jgi:hypothetical protein
MQAYISAPMGFEPTVTVFDRQSTEHSSDRTSTAIDTARLRFLYSTCVLRRQEHYGKQTHWKVFGLAVRR